MKNGQIGTHEFSAREEVVKTSSDRSFGLTFAVVFLCIGLFGLYKSTSHWPWWLVGSALFGIIGLVAPAVLAPLNRIWTKFGLLLHHVTGPIILGGIFFGVITPAGFLMRLSGKDPLRLRFDPTASTYWIKRDPPGPTSESFKNQY